MFDTIKCFFLGSEEVQSAKKQIAKLNEKDRRSLKPSENARLKEAQKKVQAHIMKIVLACGGASIGGLALGVVAQNHHRRHTPPTFSSIEELLSPLKYEPDISRENIPTKLPGLLSSYADVKPPEHYDPKKPNLYVIAQKHFLGNASSDDDPDQDRIINQIQIDILKITHLLHAIGAQTQFIEGIDNGRELTHIETLKDSGLGEVPREAMSIYQSKGRIRRAYIAAEGTYKGDLESLGIDMDQRGLQKIGESARDADNNHFSVAQHEILRSLCHRFHLAFEPIPSDSNPQQYLLRITREIFVKVKNLPPEEQEKLFEDTVGSNDHYREFVRIFSKFQFLKIAGRTQQFTRNLEQWEHKMDSFFIVGAAHATQFMQKDLSKWNMFIINPHSLQRDTINPPSDSWSEEEWRQALIKNDKKHFGFSNPDVE